MVEFAMVAPLFFLLIFAVVEFGRLFFTQMQLEEAVQEAGRYASTGNTQTGLTRLQSIEADLQKSAAGINVPISNIQISSLVNGVWVSGSAGGPSDTVLIQVTMSLNLLTPMVGQYFPNSAYSFTASTTFQNEPFPPS
ncbi:MAG TPA: TadE/TadG family type IV pilus assembly protein [Candidatus Binataceae bacterium]|nr:TadE/TadG family type IV pilus assembly protein [Candidatus Binataceae bacterium]